MRRRKGERCINSTVKYGGGTIQVWGCMSASGVGTLKVVTGCLTAKAYARLINFVNISRLMGIGCVEMIYISTKWSTMSHS